jgi:hypothetical protein
MVEAWNHTYVCVLKRKTSAVHWTEHLQYTELNTYGTMNSPIIPVMTHPILSVSLKRWVTVKASSNLSCRNKRNTIKRRVENKNWCYKLDNPQWFVNCTVTMTDTNTKIWVMYWKANQKNFVLTDRNLACATFVTEQISKQTEAILHHTFHKVICWSSECIGHSLLHTCYIW